MCFLGSVTIKAKWTCWLFILTASSKQINMCCSFGSPFNGYNQPQRVFISELERTTNQMFCIQPYLAFSYCLSQRCTITKAQQLKKMFFWTHLSSWVFHHFFLFTLHFTELILTDSKVVQKKKKSTWSVSFNMCLTEIKRPQKLRLTEKVVLKHIP